MMLSRLIGLAVAIVSIGGVTIAHGAEPQTHAANAAVQYIESLQNDDGGFPTFGAESSPSGSLDAAFALKAAGVDAANIAIPGGVTLGNYLSAQTAPAGDAGALAKLSFGLSAAGLDGGTFVDDMRQYVTHDGYGDDVFDEAFYVFALVAADEPSPVSAAYLRSIQQADGGWEFEDTFGSDSNTTAMALQALLAAGGSASEQATRDGLAYLATTQNDDGGFGFTTTDDSDANSTALVIQALVASGEDIDAGGPWASGGNTPLEGLLAFRNAATGAFQYAGEDNAFATFQVVPALMLAPFPSLETIASEEPTAVPSPTHALQRTPAVMATPTPLFVLPSAGTGPRSRAPWWPLTVEIVAVGGAAAFLAGAFMRRRS